MPDIQCPVAECTYQTGDVDNVVVAVLLDAHTAGAHSSILPIQQHRRPPKVDRPLLNDTIGEEAWNAFQQDWTMFIRANDVVIEDQSIQLFSCCDTTLKAKLTASCQDVFSKPVTDLMSLLKTIAVIPVAVSVKRNELLQMHQEAGEVIRNFLLHVKGKAGTCKFRIKCPHLHAATADQARNHDVYVDYTDEMIRHIILNGLYDDDIKRDIFSELGLDIMAVTDLVSLIEGKELARDATSLPSANTISQFKRKQEEERTPEFDREGRCSICNCSIKLFKQMRNGKYNKKPFHDCLDCWQKKNNTRKGRNNRGNDDAATEFNAVSFEISANESAEFSDIHYKTLTLNHHVFDNGDWKLQIAQPHPTVLLKIYTDCTDYEVFGFHGPRITNHNIKGIVDSGAQCCLWGWNDCRAAGFREEDVLPVKQKLNAVSKSRLNIYGAVILRMAGVSPSGNEHSCYNSAPHCSC